jgi:hypothetical protein
MLLGKYCDKCPNTDDHASFCSGRFSFQDCEGNVAVYFSWWTSERYLYALNLSSTRSLLLISVSANVLASDDSLITARATVCRRLPPSTKVLK